MDTVSVIIPVHNRSTLLLRALQSVLNQTFNDFELIVIDDGSTDNVCDLRILTCDKRITFHRLPCRCGVSKARNEGVRFSKGNWIAFLDSDDEWMSNKLQCQMEWIGNNPNYQIMQTKEIWIRNGKRVNAPVTHEKAQGDLFAKNLERCMITPSSVLLSRALFETAGGFNESLPACEDYDLWLRICVNEHVGLLDKYLLLRYGGHGDQLSATTMGLDRFRIRSILGLIEHCKLNKAQRDLAVSTLVKKATIVANGYLKRGNPELYERFISISRRFNPE